MINSLLQLALIVGAACFGALALLTDFRDPSTNRITKWGLIALFGIGFSMLLSIWLHFLEADAAMRLEEEKQSQYRKSSEQLSQILERAEVLALTLKDTSESQREILLSQSKAQREIVSAKYPLEPIKFNYTISYSMEDAAFDKYLERITHEIYEFNANHPSRTFYPSLTPDLSNLGWGVVLNTDEHDWMPNHSKLESDARGILNQEASKFTFVDSKNESKELSFVSGDDWMMDGFVERLVSRDHEREYTVIADFSNRRFLKKIEVFGPVRLGSDKATSALDLVGRKFLWDADGPIATVYGVKGDLLRVAMHFSHDIILIGETRYIDILEDQEEVIITPEHIGLGNISYDFEDIRSKGKANNGGM